MTPAAIVLAGGASTRFGSDKLAVEIGGHAVLAHAIAAARAVADPVVVVVGPDAPLPPSAAGCAVARDTDAFGGPLAGLLAGAGALPDGGVAIVVGGDMPWLVPEVLDLLLYALVVDPALGAVTLEADPPASLPMAVRVAVAGPAAAALLAAGRRSLRGLLGEVPSKVIPAATWRALDPGGATLRDVDTPEDLA